MFYFVVNGYSTAGCVVDKRNMQKLRKSDHSKREETDGFSVFSMAFSTQLYHLNSVKIRSENNLELTEQRNKD